MKLSRRTTCPSCEVGLKVADSLPAGKMIKCPKCGNGFRLTFVEDAPAAAPRTAESRLRKRAPRLPEPTEEQSLDDTDEELEERPRPRKKKKLRKKEEPANNTLLIVGLALVGALLVGGGIGG